MVDRDLAVLYGVETRNLNKAVNRNINHFPKEFMFQLTDEEFKNLMFQNGTSSWGGARKLPYVFAEHAVLMLSSVLKSDTAANMSVQIITAFIEMRKFLRGICCERLCENSSQLFQFLTIVLLINFLKFGKPNSLT